MEQCETQQKQQGEDLSEALGSPLIPSLSPLYVHLCKGSFIISLLPTPTLHSMLVSLCFLAAPRRQWQFHTTIRKFTAKETYICCTTFVSIIISPSPVTMAQALSCLRCSLQSQVKNSTKTIKAVKIVGKC